MPTMVWNRATVNLFKEADKNEKNLKLHGSVCTFPEQLSIVAKYKTLPISGPQRTSPTVPKNMPTPQRVTTTIRKNPTHARNGTSDAEIMELNQQVESPGG